MGHTSHPSASHLEPVQGGTTIGDSQKKEQVRHARLWVGGNLFNAAQKSPNCSDRMRSPRESALVRGRFPQQLVHGAKRKVLVQRRSSPPLLRPLVALAKAGHALAGQLRVSGSQHLQVFYKVLLV